MILQYIVLGFVFAAGIGPSNIETAKRGLTGRSSSAIAFYLGNVLIDVFYILLIAMGLSYSLSMMSTQSAAVVMMWLALFGILYLLYLGIGDIRDFFKKDILAKNGPKKQNLFRSAMEGVLVNLANPMAIASWVAFYSVAASDFRDSNLNLLAVVVGIILLGLTIVLITHVFKKVLGEKILRFISLAAGIMLIGFSLFFAYYLFV